MLQYPYFSDTVFLGYLAKETIINQNKDVFIDKPGGNILYSAFAYKIWGKTPGLISKVGASFSEGWIDQINQLGINVSGVKRTAENIDHRDFYYVNESGELISDNPQKYFLEMDFPFPKSLLGYSQNCKKLDNRKSCDHISIKPEDIPEEFFECQNLALCPLDFVSHSLAPVEYRSRGSPRVFFHAGKGYMHPSFFMDIPPLINGAHLFLSTEENARNLFLGKLGELWEIIEYIASFNIETTIISRPDEGYFIYNQEQKKRFVLPNYPVKTIDPVGVDDAFFGGYIAGYLNNFDPIFAAAAGASTASVKKEGSTANYLLDTLPELASGRLEKLITEIKSC